MFACNTPFRGVSADSRSRDMYIYVSRKLGCHITTRYLSWYCISNCKWSSVRLGHILLLLVAYRLVAAILFSDNIPIVIQDDPTVHSVRFIPALITESVLFHR